MSDKKLDIDYVKKELDEILKLAKAWNTSIVDKSSCIPQTIVDRLNGIRSAL